MLHKSLKHLTDKIADFKAFVTPSNIFIKKYHMFTYF